MSAHLRIPVGRGERAQRRSPTLCRAAGFATLTTGLRTALALGAIVASAAYAQPDTLYLRTLAASCAQCHGTDGHAAPGAAVPALAGRPRAELLAQLQAFKSGSRPSTIMQQLARGYTDAQLEQLAAYFASRK